MIGSRGVSTTVGCFFFNLHAEDEEEEEGARINFVALKRAVLRSRVEMMKGSFFLGAFSTDAAGQLDVLGHDGHSLGVDGAQVRVLEQTHQVGLASLLQGHHGRALEAQVGLEVLGDLTHQTLERQLADQQLGALLVATDLTESHRAGTVTVGLLHAAGSRRALAGCLRRQLLPRGLASGRLASGLLRTGHGASNLLVKERDGKISNDTKAPNTDSR